jgi:hypothetical protein
MKPIQETFLETDWENEEEARQARDLRAEQLQAQGLVCTCENLYNVLGKRVFLLEAKEAEPIEATTTAVDKTRPHLRSKRSIRHLPTYEER